MRTSSANPIWGCAGARDYNSRRAGVNDPLSTYRDDHTPGPRDRSASICADTVSIEAIPSTACSTPNA